MATDALGSWNLSPSVPNSTALTGATIALQLALGPTSTPLGFDLSNGLLLTLGNEFLMTKVDHAEP